MIKRGKKGIGVGVGKEPLMSYFASEQMYITATDLSSEDEFAKVWA